ncbi:A24 family peptidase [uncultured Brevundimonas sp.]|uniref:prepilin peptidase n=1 Tax=uncultured Brevundimonas sp. TaxID=213418 RepID=UPI0026150ED5|nr:A24 family peptidase [uncultured Brevundimonas sp.]
MSSLALSFIVLTLAGAGAGWIIAYVSQRLPEQPIDFKAPRYRLLALAGATIGGASALWAVPSFGVTAGVMTALLGWQLLLIALIDFEHFWLPDAVTVPLAVSGLLANVLLAPPLAVGWLASVVSALVAFAMLGLLALLYRLIRKRKGLGGGDPILLGAGCAWVGLQDVVIVLAVASLGIVVTVLAARLMKRSFDAQGRLPYGTYLALGFAVAWVIV